jgi:hypothetical protein
VRVGCVAGVSTELCGIQNIALVRNMTIAKGLGEYAENRISSRKETFHLQPYPPIHSPPRPSHRVKPLGCARTLHTSLDLHNLQHVSGICSIVEATLPLEYPGKERTLASAASRGLTWAKSQQFQTCGRTSSGWTLVRTSLAGKENLLEAVFRTTSGTATDILRIIKHLPNETLDILACDTFCLMLRDT